MSEDQLQVVESLRRRPWRTIAIVATTTVLFASGAAVRMHVLRSDAIHAWAERSSVIAGLGGAAASSWIAARRGDTRLLALSSGRSPELFGIPVPGERAPKPARLSEILKQSLAMLNQLHGYHSIWLFDRNGGVLGTTAAQPPPAVLQNLAIFAMNGDSGQVVGPFLIDSARTAIAFAQPVVAELPPIGGAGAASGQTIGVAVLISNPSSLLAELAVLSDRNGTEKTTLLVSRDDSVYELALTPARARGTVIGVWQKSHAPGAYLATAGDTNAAIVGSTVEFAARLGATPWVLRRRESSDVVFASVNGRLATELSSTAAIIFMIAIVVIARRQTSRERQHQQTAESEIRYRLLADNATDVIMRHAPDGRILYVSPAVLATLGYRPRQIEGTQLAELGNDNDPITAGQILEHLRETPGAYRAEHRLRHADGRYVWMETTGRAIRDPVWRNVTEIVTASRDIDARKEAEIALRTSEEGYRVLFEANPLPMWTFDADSCRFTAVNDATVAHYGYSRDEFLDKTIFDIRPAEDAPEIEQNISRIRDGVTELQGARHVTKDGRIITVDMTVHAVTMGGRPTWLVLVKDVTEATRSASAVRESNEFVRALFDSSPVAIMTTDMDLRVLQWNRAAERLFGWSAEEVMGQPYPLAAGAIAGDLAASRERALQDGHVVDIQTQRPRKDGSLVDVSVSIGLLKSAEMEPRGFVALVADVSERARLEVQLRQVQKMDAVGQLAGGIAHDFNNLLTVVTGYAGMILSELPGDAPIRGDLQEIMAAAHRAGLLTRQLLAFSRQQMLEPRLLDLNALVQGMEPMLRRLLPADIDVKTKLDPSLGWINADPGQLEQVLMNLVVNARDAMPDGGLLTLETMNAGSDLMHEVDDGASFSGDYIVLCVRDTGCGMPMAVQSRIFEPFFTTKDRGEGTGLGLSTAHGIVTQSGGRLTVQSEPGLGAVFSVCLPCAESGAVAPIVTTPGSVSTRGAESILLVEDDDSVRTTTMRILERAGYTVYSAADGGEALAIHARIGFRIGVLLTDMIMPEMSGPELVARIREREPNVAVIVMSGYSEPTPVRQRLVDAGTDFIQKPFTPDSLVQKVREALDAAVAAQRA